MLDVSEIRTGIDYFRGTAAHNTIRIDGKDQSVIGGDYMWLKKAKAECLSYRDDEEGATAEGSHDGCRRFKDPVTHRRTVGIEKKNRRIIVVDDIECRKSHKIEQFFHFHPDCELDRMTEHEYRIANHN